MEHWLDNEDWLPAWRTVAQQLRGDEDGERRLYAAMRSCLPGLDIREQAAAIDRLREGGPAEGAKADAEDFAEFAARLATFDHRRVDMGPAAECTGAALRAAYGEALATALASGDEVLRGQAQGTERLLAQHSEWKDCRREASMRLLVETVRAAGRLPGAGNGTDGTEGTEGTAGTQEAGAEAAPVDLVVPLGTGSRLDDWELRMLLRSARRNLRGLRTVHVIGPRRPGWMLEHAQVRWHDWSPVEGKDLDIVSKFLWAARCPEVSETFVGACDDWVFLQPSSAGVDWGAVQRGGVLTTKTDTHWDRAQAGTRLALEAAGLPAKFYDTHTPSAMSKAGWEQVDRTIAWRELRDGIAVWSLYHNVAGVRGPRIGRDGLAVAGWHSAAEGFAGPADQAAVALAVAHRRFLCYNDRGLTPALRAWLEGAFPEPGPWERPAPAGTGIVGRLVRAVRGRPAPPSAGAVAEIGIRVPWALDRDIGGFYNREMVACPPGGARLFLDHDALMLTPDWYRICVEAVNAHPDGGLFTCRTNRGRHRVQRDEVGMRLDEDILKHLARARDLASRGAQAVKLDTAQGWGVFMLVRKACWEEVGGFANGFDGVDNAFFRAVHGSRWATYLLDGVYCYHARLTTGPLAKAAPAPAARPAATKGTDVPAAAAGAVGTVYLAFDSEYARYAAALVQSVLALNPGWRVRAFATNVAGRVLERYPWTDGRVTAHAEQVDLPNAEDARVYMATQRFLRYRPWLPQDGFVLMADADMVCTGDLGALAGAMGAAGEDLAIIRRPNLETRRQVRACAVACRPTAAALAFWERYEAALPSQPAWYADQEALVAALAQSPALRVRDLPESVWCAFSEGPDVRLLATAGEDKAAGAPDWHRQYLRRYGECVDRADGPRGDAGTVALVWVVFGQDEARHRACVEGMAATVQTVRPGKMLLYEAHEGAPRYGAFAAAHGVDHVCLPTGPRHRNVWQKESLWQLSLERLAAGGRARVAVYLDADCEPLCADWAARVAAMWEAGALVWQPWHRTADTQHGDIGGVSASWTRSRRNGQVDHPGFAWAVDVEFLRREGGFSCVEPLGGGDTVLAQWYLANRSGLSPWADHMAWAKAGARRRVTPAALDIDLRHCSHGARANRLYTVRYPIAAMASGGNIMGLYEPDGQGLLRVRDGRVGDAWLRMLDRKGLWSDTDMEANRALWRACLAEDGPARWQDIDGWFSEADAGLYREWAQQCPQECTIVELGTGRGRSAAALLTALDDAGKPGVRTVTVDIFGDGMLAAAVGNLRRWHARVRLLQWDSIEAAALFADGAVWGVFVDTTHTRDRTLAEIAAWGPKVRADGRLGGHDYNPKDWPGVVQAVLETTGGQAPLLWGSSWELPPDGRGARCMFASRHEGPL